MKEQNRQGVMEIGKWNEFTHYIRGIDWDYSAVWFGPWVGELIDQWLDGQVECKSLQ
jgi:hypothetical protein